MEADLRVQVVAVVGLLSTEKTHVKCLERKCTSKVEETQKLVAERRETSRAAGCQLAESEESLRGLQPKIAAAAAKRNEWRELATEAAEELKVAQDDVALQSALLEFAQK